MSKTSRKYDTSKCLILWLNTKETWEGFEEVAHYIEIKHGGNISKKLDGPDTRIWFIKIKDSTISMQHDDMLGNCICSLNQHDNWIIEELEASIIDALNKHN